MTPNIIINSLDSVTVKGVNVGSITNAFRNNNADPQELHDTLKSHVNALVTAATAGAAAARTAATTATSAAASATNELANLHAQLDDLVSQAATATGDASKLHAIITQAATLTAHGRRTAKQKRIADLEAQAAKLKAEIAS